MESGNRGPNDKEIEEFFVQTRDNVSSLLSGRGGSLFLIVIVVLVLLWLASGIYVVQPGEEGVVRTFGKYASIATAGLNYHFPLPIQTATIVDVESIRRLEIGFRTTASDIKQSNFSEALMLTQDENIVLVELLVQYRIADARKFIFNVQDPEQALGTSTEVALRATVGQMTIDDVITEERARVQDETRVILSQMLEDYGTGIQVTDVRLQVADPPEEVRDAFQEVVRAKADRARLINESQAYQNDVVPRARGQKQQAIEEATAFKDQQVLRATGDAQRFLAVLEAYRLAPEVTRERMHIEALEGILDQVRLVLLDPDAVGDQVLPFLPLTDLATNPEASSSAKVGKPIAPSEVQAEQPETSSQTEGGK